MVYHRLPLMQAWKTCSTVQLPAGIQQRGGVFLVLAFRALAMECSLHLMVQYLLWHLLCILAVCFSISTVCLVYGVLCPSNGGVVFEAQYCVFSPVFLWVWNPIQFDLQQSQKQCHRLAASIELLQSTEVTTDSSQLITL